NGANGMHLAFRIADQMGWHRDLLSIMSPSKPVSPERLQNAQAALAVSVGLDIASLEAQIPKLIKKHRVAGVGVGVLQEGRLVWTGYYGEQGPDIAVSYRTLFNTASVAKTITAETIIAMAAAGQIDLDASIATHVQHPDLSKDARYASLTPRLLMSHQAGLLNWAYNYDDNRLAFVHAPGSRFSYSGAGVELAALYAQARMGEDFEALARKHVWQPAKIKNMSLGRLHPWVSERLAQPMDADGHFQPIDAFSRRLSSRSDGRWSAADDLLTSVNDYGRLLERLLQEHRTGPKTKDAEARRVQLRSTILTSLADDEVWRCQATPKVRCAQLFGHSIGWMVYEYGDHTVIKHGGNDRGENALVYFSPQTQRGAVILVNGGNGIFVSTQILRLIGDEPELAAYYEQLIERFYGSD
ncbi:MAG: serine hydrolase domain-containing protein, partial [Myxococcota bacterium]